MQAEPISELLVWHICCQGIDMYHAPKPCKTEIKHFLDRKNRSLAIKNAPYWYSKHTAYRKGINVVDFWDCYGMTSMEILLHTAHNLSQQKAGAITVEIYVPYHYGCYTFNYCKPMMNVEFYYTSYISLHCIHWVVTGCRHCSWKNFYEWICIACNVSSSEQCDEMYWSKVYSNQI